MKMPFGFISSTWSTRVLPPSSLRMKRWPPPNIRDFGSSLTRLFSSNSESSISWSPKPRIFIWNRVPLPMSPSVIFVALTVVGFHPENVVRSDTIANTSATGRSIV